jgi:hypothetical protein
VVEISGGSAVLSEVVCHLMAHLVCKNEETHPKVRVMDVQSALDYRRWWFEVRGLTQDQMDLSQESELLQSININKCETELQLLSSLRAYELEEAKDKSQHQVLIVDGLSNLLWNHWNFRKAAEVSDPTKTKNKKRADIWTAILERLRSLAMQNVTVIVTKLVFFPKRHISEDYFGKLWLSFVSIRMVVEEQPLTPALLGKNGVPWKGSFIDEATMNRSPWQVSDKGIVFAPTK